VKKYIILLDQLNKVAGLQGNALERFDGLGSLLF